MRAFIIESCDGQHIFDKYNTTLDLTEELRRMVVRNIAQHIIQTFGNWPTTAIKTHYAKLYVELFPSFRIKGSTIYYVSMQIYLIFSA